MSKDSSDFIFGAAVGTGLTAQAVDKAGADFLLVLNAGRLRMRGASSLTSYLPLRPANDWVFEIANEEILHRCKSPVLAGLNVCDPSVVPEELAQKAKTLGFAGVSNFPSAALLDGHLRELMEAEGLGFEKECQLIRAASALGLKTLGYVSTNREARMMADAGAEMICVVVGFTGGATGVSTNLTLEAAADLADRVLTGIPDAIGKLIEGGPITSPEDALTITRLSKVNGYIAGSTIDRLPLEKIIGEVARSYTVISSMRTQEPTDLSFSSDLIGGSLTMQTLRDTVQSVAQSGLSVLITGETGTGKSTIASDIHAKSKISRQMPVIVDCAGLTEETGAAQLMGASSGAIRQGVANSRGAIESAHNNSLILEEVAALSLSQQGHLLRFSETRYVQRLGSVDGRQVNVRLIATSTQSLDTLVLENAFRQDLLHRINVFHIKTPPLRDHRDDIPDLAHHFAKVFSPKTDVQFTNAALRVLINHSWPGNIRELRNAVQRILVLNSSGRIGAKDVDFLVSETGQHALMRPVDQAPNPTSEKDWIVDALRRHSYRRGETARELGITPRTLYNKIKKFQLV